jgi:arylesterase/paraoxonase
MDHLNASGRGHKDRLVVLDARGTGPLESRMWTLQPENFSGSNGDGILNLHGLDIWEDSEQTLHILLVNHRPPFDPVTGQPLDAAIVGANSTIELFEATSGANSMKHVKTYHHDSIQTPNRVAWVGDEEFVFTNDHSAKVGLVSINILCASLDTDSSSADSWMCSWEAVA